MELLKLFLKEHRGVIVAATAVLALIVAFSAARCTMVQSERALEEITKQTDDLGGTGSAPVGGADEDGKDGGLSDTEKALAKLTEEQRQRQDSYDEETAAFVSELSSNIWTARNDAYFLTFTGATFTDTAKGEATVHPYVINNLTPRPSTSENGRTVEVTEAAIETDEGIFVLTYTVTTVNETGEVTAKVASGAFSVIEQDGYTRTAATDGSLTVSSRRAARSTARWDTACMPPKSRTAFTACATTPPASASPRRSERSKPPWPTPVALRRRTPMPWIPV